MKKAVAIILVLVLALLLAGCGGKKAPSGGEDVSHTRAYEIASEVPQERVAARRIEPSSSFAGGDGSEADPYRISTAAELAYFAEVMKDKEKVEDHYDKHYVLTADIVVNDAEEMKTAATKAPEYGWEPIHGAMSRDFAGVFDGGGHSIVGLYTVTAFDGVTETGSRIGLFGRLDNAEIRDLTIADSYFCALNRIEGAGALVGEQYRSVFENCRTERVDVIVNDGRAGGLIGCCIDTLQVRSCETDGTVSAKQLNYAGGIVSSFSDGSIEICVNRADVTSGGDLAGGIAGYVSTSAQLQSWEKESARPGSTTISGCSNYGEIVSEKRSSGGIAGSVWGGNSDALITGCRNFGSVRGKESIGGIIGETTVSKNYIDKKADHQGKLTVTECENAGAVAATDGTASGIIGNLHCRNDASFEMTKCRNEGEITCHAMSGGVLGYILADKGSSTVLVSECENAGEILGDASCVGGILGEISIVSENKSTIDFKDCVNSGAVKAGSGYATGGIVGKIILGSETSAKVSFDGCENKGLLEPRFDTGTISFAGGIAGNLNGSGKEAIRLNGCVNSGEINALIENYAEVDSTNCHVGGIVGYGMGDVVVKNCKATGETNIPTEIHYDPICGLGEVKQIG